MKFFILFVISISSLSLYGQGLTNDQLLPKDGRYPISLPVNGDTIYMFNSWQVNHFRNLVEENNLLIQEVRELYKRDSLNIEEYSLLKETLVSQQAVIEILGTTNNNLAGEYFNHIKDVGNTLDNVDLKLDKMDKKVPKIWRTIAIGAGVYITLDVIGHLSNLW